MRKIIYNDENALIDNGIYFGRGLFETILVKEHPCFLKEHIQRLNEGIDRLRLGKKIELEIVENFIKANNIKNIALKVVVTEKNIIFTTREIKYTEEHYIKGFYVKFADGMRNSKATTTYLKSLNYLDNILEYEDAIKEGYNEALFFNEREQLSEGCTTNVFIIKENVIYTPLTSCGLLKGIIRDFIIKNFDVVEKEIRKEDILNADEVFLTNSIVGVIKVAEIESSRYVCNKTEKIRETYETYIDRWRENNDR